MLQESLWSEPRWHRNAECSSHRLKRKPVADGRLQSNPFMTYRDPQTGQWVVVRPSLVQPQEPSPN